MAKGLTLEFIGQNDVIKKIQDLGRDKAELVSKKLRDIGHDIVDEAKAAAPVSDNRLRGGIIVSRVTPLEVEIESTVLYSAYVEFGTGGKVQVPADLRGYAMQFKGKGGNGTFKQFIAAIMDWVKRNNIAGTYSVKTRKRTGKKANRETEDKSAAWAIAISILRNGIRAQPFFFPAVYRNYNKLLEELKRELNK